MPGVHDLGGKSGAGPVPVHESRAGFRAPWEGRVLAMMGVLLGRGAFDLDAFRHAVERMDPERYFARGYYGRWLDALQRLLEERGGLAPGELEQRARALAEGARPSAAAPAQVHFEPRTQGYVRAVEAGPRFSAGDGVRTVATPSAGHTRLPDYATGKTGRVERVYPAFVFPDTNAHARGECPEYLYHVRFDAAELWGAAAEAGTSTGIDLFESYLEPAQ